MVPAIYFNISFLASFRTGLPISAQIKQLNQNSLVSLSNDSITKDKVRVNIEAKPHTLFLAPSNSTVETINKYVTEILFEKHPPIAEVINSFRVPMKIYRHMTVIIMENRYNFLSNFISFKISYWYLLHTYRYAKIFSIVAKYTHIIYCFYVL